LALRDVLDRAAEPRDAAGGIALGLSACRNPPVRAIGADHLQNEFVGCAAMEGRFDGAPQQVPALAGIELCVFLVIHGRQARIAAGDAIKLLGPHDRIAIRIPLPAADSSEALRFLELALLAPQ